MRYIEGIKKKIPNVQEIDQLMGIEGNIRKKYYEAWSVIINQEIEFEKRVMHPPDNMINSFNFFCEFSDLFKKYLQKYTILN